MVLPTDFPPAEIIHAIEGELGLPFQHFKVSLAGDIEGIFGVGDNEQVVSFEAKRSRTGHFPSLTSMIAELDENAVKEMGEMFKKMVAEIEAMVGDGTIFEPSTEPPRFDDEWYCP
jgi:hypothetical protein